MSPDVVLVGAPGAGKTSVGAELAKQLGVDFADTDQLIEAREKRSVPEIFIDSGEDYFRGVEQTVVQTALHDSDGVLALGGGAVMDPHTRSELGAHRTVWLKVNGENAARRVGMNVPRPVLLGNVRARLNSLLKEREEFYREVADIVVATDNRPIEEVVDEVLTQLGQASDNSTEGQQ